MLGSVTNKMKVGRLAGELMQLRGALPRVEVRQSTVPGANRGLFATRRCTKDALLTLYPGFYYPPPPLFVVSSVDGLPATPIIDLNAARLSGSAYIMSCSYGGFVDASREGVADARAVGHVANHSLTKTNARVEAFLWGDGDSANINRLDLDAFWYVSSEGVPQKYHHNCAALAGIALLAARDVDAHEEIFIDYRFSKRDQAQCHWYNS